MAYRVEMITTYAGPKGNIGPGRTVVIQDAEEAQQLIDGGYARSVDGKIQATKGSQGQRLANAERQERLAEVTADSEGDSPPADASNSDEEPEGEPADASNGDDTDGDEEAPATRGRRRSPA